MRTYSLHQARAQFSKIFERALAGEPQRIARHGKDAVILVAETEWTKRPRRAPTLGALLARFARETGVDEEVFDRFWRKPSRDLGGDFLPDE